MNDAKKPPEYPVERYEQKKEEPAATAGTLPKGDAQKPSVPERQWGMPIGYALDGGQMVTLKEVVEKRTPTLETTALSPAQLAALVAERIKAQDKFEMAMMGVGIIDRERALAEIVDQKSEAGALLIKLEQRMMERVLEIAGVKTPPVQPSVEAPENDE